MSADNWAVCPKCKATSEQKTKGRRKQVEDAYGKIPADEYIRLRGQFETVAEMEQTLREDYEIGVDEKGEFEVAYSASCQCGFSFTYTHKERAPL